MFFDSLGQNVKDFIILLFIIFIVILSIYVISLNSSLTWWSINCTQNNNNDEKHKHGPNNTSVYISTIYLIVIVLIIIYTIYEYWTKGRIVGLNSFGRRLR